MKNFAPLRELRLAPRKKSFLGQSALLLGVTGSILAIAHDAGATPGAPSLLNLNRNYSNTGTLSPSSVQSFNSPALFNLYSILSQPGVVTQVQIPAATPSVPLAAPAALQPVQYFAPTPGLAPVTAVAHRAPISFAPKQDDLNHFVNTPNLIAMPQADVQTTDADGTPTWDAKGKFKNSFQAPWHQAATDFDPTVWTPDWNQYDGFTGDSFLLGLRGTEYGNAVFSRGLAYAGKPNYSQVAPVWDGNDSSVTQALFPSTAARASAAL